ncbi:MAG: PA2779 family protein [Chromatiaceae bacterium]|nr:PA2779 family protein [Chromatiaceae bacterium]
MMMTGTPKRPLAATLMALILAGTWPQIALTAPVGTGALLQQQADAMQRTRVQDKLAREDVERAMLTLGVDPAAAQARVASLTPAELAQLEQQLDQLPAGGSFFAVVGIVFVVLIILELTGVINIFTKM